MEIVSVKSLIFSAALVTLSIGNYSLLLDAALQEISDDTLQISRSCESSDLYFSFSCNWEIFERNCCKVENVVIPGPVSNDSGDRFTKFFNIRQVFYSKRMYSLISYHKTIFSETLNKSFLVNILRI